MAALFTSGKVIDLILLVVAAEALGVMFWHRPTRRRGLFPADVLSQLAPGVCLLVALRGALTGAWWGWIALWLLAALAAHLQDLARRWRG